MRSPGLGGQPLGGFTGARRPPSVRIDGPAAVQDQSPMVRIGDSKVGASWFFDLGQRNGVPFYLLPDGRQREAFRQPVAKALL